MSDDEVMQPEPADMGWLLTFADLVSLLITFFVLLYSMKVTDTQKWDELKGAFSGVFSIREPIFQVKPNQMETVEKIDPFQADGLEYLSTLLATRFRDNKVLEGSEVKRDLEHGKLIISVPSQTLFASESIEMNDEGVRSIAEFGDMLRHLDNRVEIAAHTDPFPVSTEQYPSNWELAMLRAIRVATVLKEQGIEANVPVVSYGHSRFHEVAPNLPLEARYERSRRVEIIIHQESGDPYGDNAFKEATQ